MVLFHLFCFLLCTAIRLKIKVFITNLFHLYAHDISTKTYDPLSLVLFFLGSSTISSFHFHTTVQPKYMVLYHLFFPFYTTIQQKYMVLFHLIFLLRTIIRPEIRVLTDLFLSLHTTIRSNCMVLFHLSFLLCTTIRPRARVLIDLFLIFAHDHSTKIFGPLLFILYFVHDHSTKN